MGWIAYHAKYYKNGKVDRKAECDSLFAGEDSKSEVLKSVMVGRVYYAAVKYDKDVHAVVIVTSGYEKDYNNFWYKCMDESMDPYYYDCPKNILDMLTETDNEWAIEWRNKCREQLKKKGKIRELGKKPIGTKITVEFCGETWHLEKTKASGFSKPIWADWSRMKYLRPKQIVEARDMGI